MNYKKIIVISILLLVLSVAAVSANDIDDNYATESLEVDDSLAIEDSFLASSQIQNSQISTSPGTFEDLQAEINNLPAGAVLNLTRDYNGHEGAIVHIDRDITIDGKGHTIDCLKECVAFTSESGSITLKNLNIINGFHDGPAFDEDPVNNGGAIIIRGSAKYTIDNCTFKDNWADDCGGAIYMTDDNTMLTVKNCLFQNNEADDSYGGAISGCSLNFAAYNSVFENNRACDAGAIQARGGIISGCLFKSNKAYKLYFEDRSTGGAIYSNRDLFITNSTFIDNSAEEGGAIYMEDGDVYINDYQPNQVITSSFINNKAELHAGAIYADDIVANNCLFEGNRVDAIVAQTYGGAIYADDVILNDCTFKDNYADDWGGAIYACDVFINVNQSNNLPLSSFFIGNKANDNQAGAIYAKHGVSAVNTLFSNNIADKSDGGAIYTDNVIASNCQFERNSAENNGGAICANDNVNVDHCLFESNSVDGAVLECRGGAIYAGDDVRIDNCTFNNNYARDYGGAVYANNVYVNNNQISSLSYNSFFTNNKAGDNDGGALYSYYDLRVKNAKFTGNGAYEDGGAIFCCDNAYVTHCLFENNKADGSASAQCEGGAIHCKDDLTVENSIFNNNFAYDYGGAIYADYLTLKPNCCFDSNTAYDNQGGAIWVNNFRENVRYAVFFNNHAGEGAKDDGGAIYIDETNPVTFSQCAFIINHCGDEGGAIYLDSIDAHLTLKNNYFLGNTAGDEGQVVFNKGHYDAVTDNWWADNLPSTNNDLLIEWEPIWANDHRTDSNPVYMKLKLTENICNVGNSVWATVCFYHYNDGSLCSGVMDTDLIGFLPNTNLKFYNRIDHEYYVNILVKPLKSGLYTVTANLYGQFASATLSAYGDSKLADSHVLNEPIPLLFDEDYAGTDENNGNSGNTNVAKGNQVFNIGNTNISDLNNDFDNSTNGSSVSKSIGNPQTNSGDNNLWWIILAIVAVIAAGGIIKKYKS